MGLLPTEHRFLDRFRQSLRASRPPLEGLYIYVLSALIGYTIADLSVLSLRPAMLPTEAPPSRPSKTTRPPKTTLSSYRPITTKNIFNADGKIPPPLAAGAIEDKGDTDGPAVPSKLPLKLLGTIVHVNPARSVATIQVASKNVTNSFKVGHNVEGLAEITRIERRKIIFRNLNNRRLEYIEIPVDTKITFGKAAPKRGRARPGQEIQKAGDFEFTIDRSTLDKYTSDLSSILKQARMVPNIVPGSGGQVEGFRFVSIKPDSIFGKLGFKAGDTIKTVNGDPVNSPTKAMELYNTLKTSDEVNLGVNRNGRDEEFRYRVQ